MTVEQPNIKKKMHATYFDLISPWHQYNDGHLHLYCTHISIKFQWFIFNRPESNFNTNNITFLT